MQESLVLLPEIRLRKNRGFLETHAGGSGEVLGGNDL